MKIVTVDFINVKYIGEMHKILKAQLKFPEWYGENLDALWDMITGYTEPCEVHIEGIAGLPSDIKPYAEKIYNIFAEAESTYKQISVRKVD